MRRRNSLVEDRGMMTVEAAAIVPLLVFFSVVLLYFLFFLADMAAAHSEAARLADETAYAWKTEGKLATGDYREATLKKLAKHSGKNLTAKGKKRLRNRLERRLNIATVQKASVTVSGRQAIATVRLRFGNLWTFTCTRRAALCEEEAWLRENLAKRTE